MSSAMSRTCTLGVGCWGSGWGARASVGLCVGLGLGLCLGFGLGLLSSAPLEATGAVTGQQEERCPAQDPRRVHQDRLGRRVAEGPHGRTWLGLGSGLGSGLGLGLGLDAAQAHHGIVHPGGGGDLAQRLDRRGLAGDVAVRRVGSHPVVRGEDDLLDASAAASKTDRMRAAAF